MMQRHKLGHDDARDGRGSESGQKDHAEPKDKTTQSHAAPPEKSMRPKTQSHVIWNEVNKNPEAVDSLQVGTGWGVEWGKDTIQRIQV